MESRDKSNEQRFGHVNATNLNSYLNIIFISYTISEKKNRTYEVLDF